MKKLALKIPIIHVISILVYALVVYMMIEKETQGRTGVHALIYSLTFFLTNDFITLMFTVLLMLPFPLLIFAVFKKRRDLIIGFSISTLTSILLIVVGSFF